MASIDLGVLADDAVIVFDTDGQIVAATVAFASLVGFPVDAIVGQTPPHSWWPEADVGLLNTVLRGLLSGRLDEVAGLEVLLRARHADGHDIPILTRALRLEPRPDDDRTLYAMIHRLADPARQTSERSLDKIAAGIEDLAIRLRQVSGSPESPPKDAREGARERLLARLSPREAQVLEMLMAGLRMNAIAESLHISTHTVRNHARAIYRKAGVHSHVELLTQLGPTDGSE